MKWTLVLAAMLLGGCGSDEAPIVVVEVDTAQLTPTPDSLFLTLATADGASIAHTSDVAASGRTRIEILASEHTPDQASLTVAAYAGRNLIAQSQPVAVRFVGDQVATVKVALP